MDFSKFPLDEQLCYFRLGSSSYGDTWEVYNATLKRKEIKKILQYDVEYLPLTKEQSYSESVIRI